MSSLVIDPRDEPFAVAFSSRDGGYRLFAGDATDDAWHTDTIAGDGRYVDASILVPDEQSVTGSIESYGDLHTSVCKAFSPDGGAGGGIDIRCIRASGFLAPDDEAGGVFTMHHRWIESDFSF